MATKKITELPFINTLSGSTVFDNPVLNTVVPVVLYGTTNQITVENFSKFTNLYAAQTGSQNTFTAQNIFNQNQWFNAIVSASTINVGTLGVGGNTTIVGTLGVTGNGTIGGNLVVNGKLTAQEVYTEITSASIIFESGSTKFGDDTGDKHQFTGSINVSGSVIYNGVTLTNIDANTIQRLQQATASIQVATASLQFHSASVDAQLLAIQQTTQSLQVATASLQFHSASVDAQLLRLQQTTQSLQIATASLNAFTESFNSISGSYATTASNAFLGNQQITGSLSITNGEFNVTTGSGNMTSSLIFDHTQNDGVTLKLRHNDRLSVADHTFNVNVWAAGVYTQFVRNGTPYSILNVEAFDNNNIYLYRDTRLYNKSLVIDNNLTVQKEVVIGSGSLSIQRGQFNAVTGSGALTSSLSFTHTEVDPITGNGTLELRYRNNQVGSENNAWKFVATDNGVQLRYDQYTTSNKMLFSVSSFGSNFDKLLIWRDVRLFGTGLTVDDSLLVKGVITGSLLATNGVVSSSNQLFELNQFTASQDSRNLTLSTVTGSLIGITNGLMAFTASLDNTYATDAQLYQLYQATRSLELHSGSMVGVTNGLMAYTASLKGQAIVSSSTQIQNYDLFALNSNLYNGTGSIKAEVAGIESYTASLKAAAIVSSSTQVQNYDVFALNSNLYTSTGSLIGITNGLMAFTAALDSTYATDAQLYQLYQSTQSLELTTGSLIGITNGLMAFTAALDSTYATDAQLYQLYAETASIKAEIGGIEAYTASLKGAAIVSSSQQITNYYKFAETASANTFYGTQTISGSANINRSSNSGGGSDFPRFKVQNSLATQGDGSTTFNFADILISSGNEAVNMFLATTYAAGSWAPAGIINVATNHGLQIKTNNTTALNIASGGDVTVSTGNLVIGTDGKGIDFSANSNAAGMTSELLNDYEEGTWTPTVTFVGTPGTVNYISRTGRYTKIGRIVHCEYNIIACSITGSVGYVTITGLPFTINASSAGYQSFAPYGNGNLNFPSSSILYQQGGTGDTKIYPQILNNSGFYSDMTNSNINSGGVFNVVASYTYST